MNPLTETIIARIIEQAETLHESSPAADRIVEAYKAIRPKHLGALHATAIESHHQTINHIWETAACAAAQGTDPRLGDAASNATIAAIAADPDSVEYQVLTFAWRCGFPRFDHTEES